MRVVFLDFDGVINGGSGPWWPDLVTRLNHITDHTGAVIVVHSTWRYERTLQQLRDILANYTRHPTGVTGTVVGACDWPLQQPTKGGLWVLGGEWERFKADMTTDDERAIAIQRWLNEYPDISRYIILDDSKALGHFVGTPEFIKTDPSRGLQDVHVDRAILYLTGIV